jgi:oxygen-independent coproporphyrinogen III oxidase
MNDQPELPGLYVHVPFCKTKCPYCDFYSETSAPLIPAWLQAVKKEALLYREHYPRFDTLYLGGGTPTVLDELQLAALIEHFFKTFHITPGAEITIEANPGDMTGEKLSVLRGTGVNRISLGVQSFDEQDLLFLRRRHTAAEAVAAFALIRSYGVARTGIDLIYGIPGQTAVSWRATLAQAVSLQPEHISCYQLTIAEGTVFCEMKERGSCCCPLKKRVKTFSWSQRGFSRKTATFTMKFQILPAGKKIVPATTGNTGGTCRIWASGPLPIHFRTTGAGGTAVQ